MKTKFIWILSIFISFLFFSLPLRSEEYQQKTNLPTFYITTDDGRQVSDKTTWKDGSIVVKSSEASEELNVRMQIRGRGNSTLNMAKKPYRMKFLKGEKTNLLGMPAKERNWVLLANYADKTLIRNAVAFEIGSFLNMEYTPPVRFADVVYNGKFQGNYMITDQIEVAKNRVPVEEQETNFDTEPGITGGYLLEMDGFADSYPPEPEFFYSQKDYNVKFVIKYPKDDEINNAQRNYIKNYIAEFENRLFGNNFADKELGYRAMVDTVSLVNWYIACELTGNSDSFWQMYMYKKRYDNRLYFGPLWDYDIAFNNDNRLSDGGWNNDYKVEAAITKLMRQHAHEPRNWIARFWEDYWFREAVGKRWKELIEAGILDHMLDYIDETAAYLSQSQQRNFQTWNILNQRVYNEVQLFSTYQAGIAALKDYMEKRVAFLTSSFIVPEDQKPSVPFVAENRMYKIANRKVDKVFSVANDLIEENAVIVAWDKLDENDEAQLWNIQAMDNGYFRILDSESNYAITSNGKNNNIKLTSANEYNDAQLWEIVPVGVGNTYGFVNKSSGYSINNSGGGTTNGNNIIEYDSKVHQGGSDNQNWYFHKLPLREASTEPLIAIQGLGVYPNPASSYAYVDFYCEQGIDAMLSVFDIAGKQIYTTGYKYMSGQESINLPVGDFNSGVYFVVVKTSDGSRYTAKLIVQ